MAAYHSEKLSCSTRNAASVASVKLPDGTIVVAEIHWYEATGIGRMEFKIKNLL